MEVGCSYEARSGFLNLCSVSERAIIELEWFSLALQIFFCCCSYSSYSFFPMRICSEKDSGIS